TGRLVLEALLRVERLLARREEELLPAVPTHQHLVLRFHGSHVSSEVRSERATAGRRGRPLTSLERAGGRGERRTDAARGPSRGRHRGTREPSLFAGDDTVRDRLGRCWGGP